MTSRLSNGATMDEADAVGQTPLWLAARHGRLPVAQVLVKEGADASHQDAGWLIFQAEMSRIRLKKCSWNMQIQNHPQVEGKFDFFQ